MVHALGFVLGLSILAVGALFLASIDIASAPTELSYERPLQPEAVATTSEIVSVASTTDTLAEEPVKEAVIKPKEDAPAAKSPSPPPETNESEGNQVFRIENPYSAPQKSADALNTESRSALVNIFCLTQGSRVGSISGSGIIIDPRGVILTNAHVAQYILLASQPEIALDCSIRTGAPATARWKADILHIPEPWVRAHAKDIVQTRPKGSGEYDYALLMISKSVDSSPLPPSFPYLPVDTREVIAFTGDTVLIAGYPAEFAGGGAMRSSLYPSTVYNVIQELLTFVEGTVDLLALGNVVLAQSGSSGGAAINAWGYVVGLIATTSEGATTGERNLSAITLSYIDRDIQARLGISLNAFLSGDVAEKSKTFMENEAPSLAKEIMNFIP